MTEETLPTLDDCLRAADRAAQDIAAAIGTTPQNLSRWRTGTRTPSPEWKGKLEREFNTKIRWTRKTRPRKPGDHSPDLSRELVEMLRPVLGKLGNASAAQVMAATAGGLIGTVMARHLDLTRPGQMTAAGIGGSAFGLMLEEYVREILVPMLRDAREAPPEEKEDADLFCPSCGSGFFNEDITHAVTSLRGQPLCPACGHGVLEPTGSG